MVPLLAIVARVLAGEPAGSLESYLERAEEHPAILAAVADEAAAAHAVPLRRALPEPSVRVGGFFQSVETRVGPQQVRVGVRQDLPWPGRLHRRARAAEWEAAAAEARIEAARLEVRAAISEAYWSLWERRQVRERRREHLVLLEGLASAVRGRLEVGGASLAELQQVELARARLEDRVRALDAEERAWIARLEAAVGAPVGDAPTVAVPVPSVPPEALAERVAEHPRIRALEASEEAAGWAIRAARTRRMPDLSVGMDWIVTGEPALEMEGGGKDAVVGSVGLRLPLWQGTYAHAVGAATERARALQHRRRALEDALQGRAAALAASLEDSARRIDWIEHTLLPQAQAAYEAVLGDYTVGRAPIADVLLAQRSLLDLAVELVGWTGKNRRQAARLEALIGGPW